MHCARHDCARNLKLGLLIVLVIGNMSAKFQTNRTENRVTGMAQSWWFLGFFVIFANFRDFCVTLRSSRERDFWNFCFKPSLRHNNDPCPSYTSSITSGVLQGLWKTTAKFAYFIKYQKWLLPKLRQLSARISRKVKEIATWMWGYSESSDNLLTVWRDQNFAQMLPSCRKIGLKVCRF